MANPYENTVTSACLWIPPCLPTLKFDQTYSAPETSNETFQITPILPLTVTRIAITCIGAGGIGAGRNNIESYPNNGAGGGGGALSHLTNHKVDWSFATGGLTVRFNSSSYTDTGTSTTGFVEVIEGIVPIIRANYGSTPTNASDKLVGGLGGVASAIGSSVSYAGGNGSDVFTDGITYPGNGGGAAGYNAAGGAAVSGTAPSVSPSSGGGGTNFSFNPKTLTWPTTSLFATGGGEFNGQGVYGGSRATSTGSITATSIAQCIGGAFGGGSGGNFTTSAIITASNGIPGLAGVSIKGW